MKFVRWNETSSSGVVKPYGFKGLTQNFREVSELAYERAFLSLLADSICESIHHTLGKDVLSLLVSKGFLDDMANPRELDRQLSTVFGNASLMLERIIVKGLYLKLSIPYDSNLGFRLLQSPGHCPERLLRRNTSRMRTEKASKPRRSIGGC